MTFHFLTSKNFFRREFSREQIAPSAKPYSIGGGLTNHMPTITGRFFYFSTQKSLFFSGGYFYNQVPIIQLWLWVKYPKVTQFIHIHKYIHNQKRNNLFQPYRYSGTFYSNWRSYYTDWYVFCGRFNLPNNYFRPYSRSYQTYYSNWLPFSYRAYNFYY